MNIIIGILIGGLIVGFVWALVYFNQEIIKLRAECRHSTYKPTNYVSYGEGMLRKERDSLAKRVEELEDELAEKQ